MKKFSMTFILTELAALLAISFIVGLIIAACMGAEDLLNGAVSMGGIVFFFGGCVYLGLSSAITQHFAEKTMEKNSKEKDFREYSTFYSSGAIIRIDEVTGRIAYVANQNPFEFQMISARDISKIRTHYIKGPLGGTSYVCFEFVYNGKRVKIPTFTSNQVYSMESSEVLTAISKADAYCEILQNAQNAMMENEA